MAKRDPLKTQRNKEIELLTGKLKTLLPSVLNDTGVPDILSLHGIIGGKNAKFINLHSQVISTPDEYVSVWLEGYKRSIDNGLGDHHTITNILKKSKTLKEYLYIFLKRTFLNEYDALSRCRPSVDQSEIWIGSNNADYGLLVTPRFANGDWENDKSEIRHFECEYWTIAHILKTGLVTPKHAAQTNFADIKQYLTFFRNTLVRNSGSTHELEIADKYVSFVNGSANPDMVPLLIPEFRYGGRDHKHQYRLDFTVISEGAEHPRVGFELSPWSSHGHISKTKSLSQKEINEIARDNFEEEMKKHRSYFKKHSVFVQIYTDKSLKDLDSIFEDIKKYLIPTKRRIQLNIPLFQNVLGLVPKP